MKKGQAVFAIFCKTCSNDKDVAVQLLESIKKYNKDAVPTYLSVAKKEEKDFLPLKNKFDFTLMIDEDIAEINNTDKGWISQQLVKLNFYKTNVAKHFLVIDSDCYFIRDFYIKDFIYDENTPYVPLTDYYKGERIFLQLAWDMKKPQKSSEIAKFFKRTGKSVTIDMPFVMTTDYMKEFERYLKTKKLDFQKIIKMQPYEMQWYVEFLYASDLKYKACSAFFMPIHIETQYQVLRKLGFTEKLIRYNYIGILMNKGHVKSKRFKGSIFGKFNLQRIKFNYGLTRKRTDNRTFQIKNNILRYILEKLVKLISIFIPVKSWRKKVRNLF